MRVVCPHCSKKAIITSSNAMSKVNDLYCQSSNTKDYGGQFCVCTAFNHDFIHPTLQIAASLINNLKPNQRKQLQVDLFG